MATTQESTIRWPLGLNLKALVGAGNTAIVARLDAVVKFYEPSKSRFLEREHLIYRRLGCDHAGIIRFHGVIDNAIVLQFAVHGSIRQYLTRHPRTVPLSHKIRWVEQVFDAVRFVHSKDVFHGDISCNNIFLDDELNVKLGDFAGSAIDSDPPLGLYETRSELPDEDISPRTELFALGSTTYEIITGSKIYEDLQDHEITEAFFEGRFPDLGSLPIFSTTITRCWNQHYTTVEEALADVREEAENHKSRSRGSLIRFPILGCFVVVSLFAFRRWIRR